MAAHNSDLEARVRAARYPVEVPLTYQAAPDGDWLEGRSMNVSDSGLLFSTANPILPANARIGLRLQLSLVHPGAADIACSGHIVRGRFGDGAPDLSVMAAAFDHIELDGSPAPSH
jgi:hypothetical protein